MNVVKQNKSNWLLRLVGCFRHLGWKNGWRYWNLDRAARKDSYLIERTTAVWREWAESEWENGMIGKDQRDTLIEFANYTEERNKEFHSTKDE